MFHVKHVGVAAAPEQRLLSSGRGWIAARRYAEVLAGDGVERG